MNIYKCTLLALTLSTQSILATAIAERPSDEDMIRRDSAVARELMNRSQENSKCNSETEEGEESREESQVENSQTNCKKGPLQNGSENSPFNPDYNSDPEEITPIGGVSGGTKRGIVTLIASIVGNDDFKGSQKIMSEHNLDNLHQGTKELVITVDDGPTPGVTEKILDALAKYNAQGVFFVIGDKAKRHPELLARMQREGHIVANHSMTHANLGDVSFFKRKKVVQSEILGAHEVIKNYATNSPRYYFRAPYGSWEKAAAKVINKTDIGQDYVGPLLWDIGGEMDTKNFTKAADWACWSKKVSVANCFLGYKNYTRKVKGGVVLFHSLKKESAQLIERFLKEFSEDPEYRFISIDDVQID